MDQNPIKRYTYLVIGAFFLLFASCAEDGVQESNGETFILPQSQEVLSATLHGLIIDENDVAIPGAQVVYHSGVNEQTVTTDDFGYFILKDIENKGNAAFISITSPGKFEAFRKFSVLRDRYNYTEVKMLDRTIVGTVQSAQGGEVELSSGAQLALPANGIVDGQDRMYDGPVQVAMQWIDPSAEDLAQRMIGDLSGIDENGGFRSLTTFGMLTIELTDNSGNPLNLGNDAEAELRFPIPPSMIANASQSIPLWSYEENLGTWIQEGTAIREGDAYVGFVTHFSSFNVDHLDDPIAIEGQVVLAGSDGDEIGLSYLQIFVCSDNIGRKGGWLADDGSFRFYNFPKGEDFFVKVLDRCGDEIFNEKFGPYDADTEIEKIVVETSTNVVKIVGSAFACDGSVMENSLLSVKQDGRSVNFPIDEKGAFEFTTDFCDNETASLFIADLDALLSVEEVIDPLKETNTFMDLALCDELEDIITIEIAGTDPIILTPNVATVLDTMDMAFVSIAHVPMIQSGASEKPLFEIFFTYDLIAETVTEVSFILISSQTLACSQEGNLPNDAVTVDQMSTTPGDFVSGTFRFENVFCEGTDVNGEVVIEGTFSVPVE